MFEHLPRIEVLSFKNSDTTSPSTATLFPTMAIRYRHGEAISTAFVESTVNQVVSKRIVGSRCGGHRKAPTYCASDQNTGIERGFARYILPLVSRHAA
jgi:hypothetical protein